MQEHVMNINDNYLSKHFTFTNLSYYSVLLSAILLNFVTKTVRCTFLMRDSNTNSQFILVVTIFSLSIMGLIFTLISFKSKEPITWQTCLGLLFNGSIIFIFIISLYST